MRGSALLCLFALGAAQGCAGHPASTDSLGPATSSSASSSAASSLPSAPAIPPAFDVPFDIRLRTQLAQTHLGDDAQVDIEEGVFVLVASKGARSFQPSVAMVRQAIPALYNGRFSRRPTRPVSVFLFDDKESYGEFCKTRYHEACPSPFGVYASWFREIFVDQHYGISTVIHELVHPILEADFPRAPRWLREGISALFETPIISGTEIHGTKGWRSKDFHDPFEPEKPARLDALFSLPDDAFTSGASVARAAYAIARFACYWLDSPGQNNLWKFYQRWRDHLDEDPTGEKSFGEVMGQTPHEASDAWQKWVRSQ
jgi:hypothetical protein